MVSIYIAYPAQCQENNKEQSVTSADTVHIKKGTSILVFGTMYTFPKDTFYIITTTHIPTIEVERVHRSSAFYDSVYKKLSRRKFTRMLYALAFREPEIQTLPGTVEKINSESPFERFKGKVIRRIRIVTLDPFGTSTLDTTERAITGIGKGLNKVHMQTRNFVIRKNLMVKEGDTIDPILLAENEKNIREMPSIDNVFTLVSLPNPASDSADVTIITKDVWSIGFDVVSATNDKAIVRVYDGNFLGLNARLSTNFSSMLKRSPFFQLDGIVYTYNNIAGTFLNAQLNYLKDDDGNQNLGAQINRNFYSYKTKWAGGGAFMYNKMVYNPNLENGETDKPDEISYYNDMNIWGGRAFLLKGIKRPTRFVITELLFHRGFTSRPVVSIDSNRRYYNISQVFTSFSLSRNNFYLSDYILQFGKTENIPYGSLFKITLGPERTDFYTRFYGAVDLSAGNFLGGFGYLSARGILGGYLYHKSVEDAVVKVSLKYITPLLLTPDNKFRFRAYLLSDYRYGFNFRNNNEDYTNINNDLKIDKVEFDTIFHGLKSLSSTLSLVMYVPLYFYGFKFAFTLQVKGGFVSGAKESLFHKPLYTGLGFGIMIHNDNLIFPTFMISGYYYPAAPVGVPWDQFRFDQNATITLPDYNVTMPRSESLLN